jgi:hypothetical protein
MSKSKKPESHEDFQLALKEAEQHLEVLRADYLTWMKENPDSQDKQASLSEILAFKRKQESAKSKEQKELEAKKANELSKVK